MKRVVPACLFIVFAFYSYGQSWQRVGSGVNGEAGAFAVFNNELYIGGAFTSPIYVTNWNGSMLNTGASGFTNFGAGAGVSSLFSFDSVLYATGQFDFIGTLPCRSIAQWNGTSWDTVGQGLIANISEGGYSLLVQNRELYAGGFYTDTVYGKILNSIGKWNGKNWDTLEKGVYGTVFTLANYNGDLYVGGQLDVVSSQKIQELGIWNGSKWDSVGMGRPLNSDVYSMAVFNGKLYVGGVFTTAGGHAANYIASWDGTKWDSLGSGCNNDVLGLVVYDGMLIAGGSFDSAGGKPASEIAAWDGTNWHTIGAGLQGGNEGVWGMGVYDSALYAGGDFTASGGTVLNNIAVWQGPLGINDLKSESEELRVYPNPSNGIFTFSLNNNTEKSILTIYNMLGESIYTTEFNTATTQVDLSGQLQGVYLYRMVGEDGELVAKGKLAIL